MELVVKHVHVEYKNLEGLTAVDITKELKTQENGEALQILHNGKAKRGSSIINSRPKYSSLAKYFSSPVNILEKISNIDAYLDMGLPGEMRNAVPVVAVLMATAVYQAVLSPPSRLQGIYFLDFITLNTFSFAISLAVIILVLPCRLYNLILYISLLAFMIGCVVVVDIMPWGTRGPICTKSIKFGFFTFVCVIASLKIFLMLYNVWTSRFSQETTVSTFTRLGQLCSRANMHTPTRSDGAKV